MNTKSLGVFLPVSEVFPDIESNFETFKSLLLDLSLNDALFWCARFNLVISNPDADHLTKQRFVLNQLFTPEEINRVNDFASKRGGAQAISIFFSGQLRELIRWILLYCRNLPGDGTTFEDPEIRRKFAKAALIASDIWSKRVFASRFSLDGGITVARKRSLGSIRKSIEATAQVPNLPQSLGRGWELFTEYLPKYYPSFEKEFQEATQLSIEEYYICITAIRINFMNPKIGTGIFNFHELVSLPLCGNIFHKYLKLESQTENELRKSLWGKDSDIDKNPSRVNYSLLPLREKPIFFVEDGRAIILDPIFYSEKASIGPLFLLPQEKRAKAIADFGNAFEDYVCDMLKRMFPDVSGSVNKRLSCNIIGTIQKGEEVEIDACLNDITDIVLFETKTGLIREDKILIDDYEKYLQHLRAKYVQNDKVNKGVGQLAKIINLLASQKWLGENQEFTRAEQVYPVLIVHDPLLSAPVYGQFFASEFIRLLEPDNRPQSGVCRKGNLRITLPIVVTIDDLENLETSIEHFAFRDLLSEYSRTFPDRLESLHNFIAFSQYQHHIYHNRNTASAALDIIEKSKNAIFPETEDKAY